MAQQMESAFLTVWNSHVAIQKCTAILLTLWLEPDLRDQSCDSHAPSTTARTRSQRPNEVKETPRSRAPGCPYHQVPLHLKCSEEQSNRGMFQKSDILGKSIIAMMARLEGIKNRHPVVYIKIPSEYKRLQPLKLNLIAYFQSLKCQDPQAEVILVMA